MGRRFVRDHSPRRRRFPNYPDLAHAGDPAHYYGEHLPRLREVKATYDPAGLFRCGIGL
ncbi:MAG: BBE domain-containing protein [Actinophytocola sp.]|uniref:BBE domain-containing protein n=1 Tax=Actinophytocola sp. TaxID=1872138 RepID=UPI003D6C0134